MISFSQRLNDWIEERVKSINITETSDSSLVDVLNQDPNNLTVFNGNCESTLFGDPKINVKARAWHDQIHVKMQLEFTLFDELQVTLKQISELPEDWDRERLLLLIDIVGQVGYCLKYTGDTIGFPSDQREWTNKVLKTGEL